jgi:hypothetical protein
MSSHFHPGLDNCTPIHPRSFATGNNSFVHGYEGTPFQQDNVKPQTARISTRMQRLEEAGVDVLLGPSPFARSMVHRTCMGNDREKNFKFSSSPTDTG